MSDEKKNLAADVVRAVITFAPEAFDMIEALVHEERAKRVGELRPLAGAPTILATLAELESKADKE